MRLAESVVIFCLAITAAALPLADNTTSTERHSPDSHHQNLGDGAIVRRQAAAGNGTGHTQIYCHNETDPPIYFSNYQY